MLKLKQSFTEGLTKFLDENCTQLSESGRKGLLTELVKKIEDKANYEEENSECETLLLFPEGSNTCTLGYSLPIPLGDGKSVQLVAYLTTNFEETEPQI